MPKLKDGAKPTLNLPSSTEVRKPPKRMPSAKLSAAFALSSRPLLYPSSSANASTDRQRRAYAQIAQEAFDKLAKRLKLDNGGGTSTEEPACTTAHLQEAFHLSQEKDFIMRAEETEAGLTLHLVMLSTETVPAVKASVTILPDLNWSVCVWGRKRLHACCGPIGERLWRIRSGAQLQSLLNSVKKRPDLSEPSFSATTEYERVLEELKTAAEVLMAEKDKEGRRKHDAASFRFLFEQLQRIGKASQIPYDIETMSLAVRIHSHSIAAYKNLRQLNALHLPSVRTVQVLKAAINGNPGDVRDRIAQELTNPVWTNGRSRASPCPVPPTTSVPDANEPPPSSSTAPASSPTTLFASSTARIASIAPLSISEIAKATARLEEILGEDEDEGSEGPPATEASPPAAKTGPTVSKTGPTAAETGPAGTETSPTGTETSPTGTETAPAGSETGPTAAETGPPDTPEPESGQLNDGGSSQPRSANKEGNSSQTVDTTKSPEKTAENLAELKEFVKSFKEKRNKLGKGQGAVGAAIGFSQTTITRFESMDLSFKNMCSLRPLLAAWLERAENPRDEGSTPQEVKSSEEAAETIRRRKKRTNIESQHITQLEALFAANPRPLGHELARIATDMAMDREVIRVWFCNRRQKAKKLAGVTSHLSNTAAQRPPALQLPQRGGKVLRILIRPRQRPKEQPLQGVLGGKEGKRGTGRGEPKPSPHRLPPPAQHGRALQSIKRKKHSQLQLSPPKEPPQPRLLRSPQSPLRSQPSTLRSGWHPSPTRTQVAAALVAKTSDA